VGKEDVLRFYGDLIDGDRIRVLPFVPSPYLVPATPEQVEAVRHRHHLPDRYLLMPAQFWPHKNHRRVVEALASPAARDADIHVVMTGGALDGLRQQTLTEIRETIDALAVGDRVHLTGQVADEEMAALYGASTGVILPTFFGPTNIPVVEAWALGVPVLTSDIRGIREQCRDAAWLVDPRSVDAIAHGMVALWTDEGLRARLVAAGSARHASWSTKEFNAALGTILDEVLGPVVAA
jgi:glycosyltransferase involved in cell wall biosynthesis